MKHSETRTNATPLVTSHDMNESWPVELMELLPVAVFECDLSGKVTRHNSRASELWGGGPKQGEKIADLLGPVMDETLIRGEVIRNRQVVLVRINGDQVKLGLNVTPLRNKAGELTGAAGCFQVIHDLKESGAEMRTDVLRNEENFKEAEAELPTGFEKAAVIEDVSEQKRLEDALYESELRFRTIFENAGVGMGLGDMSGHPIKANRALQEMLGYSEEELCGMRITEFTHPDDANRGWHLYEELVSGRRNRFDTEKRYIRKDGGIVWARLIVSLIRDRAGRPEYTICLVVDLTERQMAERALQESQMHLQAILDNSPVLMWLKNSEGRYLQVNRKFEQCFGLAKEQILGRSDAELFPNGQATAFRVHDLKVIETGRALEFEELANYHGNHHTSIVYKFPLHDDEGRVYAVGGIAADITERKQAEDALGKQKEILQTIFDHIPVMINLVDADGRIQLANREWEQNLGWTLEELRKKNLDIFSICYPTTEERQAVLDFLARADGEWGDFSPKIRSGKRIDTAWAQVRLSDGRSLGIGQDITERKHAEVELRTVNERLHNLSRRLLEVQESERRTISRALHDEIGQAITAVALSLKNAKTAAGPAQYASALDEGIETLNLVLQQIRNLSLDLRPSMLDDLGLASAIRWQVDKQAQRAGIIANVKADDAGMRLPPDVEVACYRIVQEALTNVVRHSKAKNVRVKLWVSDSDLQLLIQDDGIGFDTGVVLGRGTNLGLIGMEERVSLLGGIFEIDSAEGCGTSVKASFPLGQFSENVHHGDAGSTGEEGKRERE